LFAFTAESGNAYSYVLPFTVIGRTEAVLQTAIIGESAGQLVGARAATVACSKKAWMMNISRA
jgi:hypothetical protein